jgi:BirA family biotin operon repressor/biotin-[acetyl-CoA-carboxylase] ligase
MDRAARLRQALEQRGVPWSAPLEWHETLGSTNDLLKERARAGTEEWTSVLADSQTGGRGREGRTWVSPPGGLYLSVLLRPESTGVGLLPLAAGVVVSEVAQEHGVEAELKWPNDALVRGRKLAGILTEASSGSGGVDWVVVGIGINVAVDVTALVPPAADVATSLHLEAAGTPAVFDVAAGVLARLSVWYDALQHRPASVVDAWRGRASRWWGMLVQVRTAEDVFRGRLHDVDESGALIVDLEGGGSRRVLSGEVTRLRPVGLEPGDGQGA